MKKIRTIVIAWLVLLFGPASPSFSGSAQEAAKEPPALQYEVAVTLKLIQACVTDKKGQPVRDLARGDFAVTGDGRPMTLTESEKHDLDAPGLHFLETEIRPDDKVALISSTMIYGNQVGQPSHPYQAQKFDMGDQALRSANENLLREFGASNCTVFAFDTRESAKVPALFEYDERMFAYCQRNISTFRDLGVFQSANAPSRAGTSEVQVLELPLGKVPPGACHLYVLAEDGTSRARAHARLRLVIR